MSTRLLPVWTGVSAVATSPAAVNALSLPASMLVAGPGRLAAGLSVLSTAGLLGSRVVDPAVGPLLPAPRRRCCSATQPAVDRLLTGGLASSVVPLASGMRWGLARPVAERLSPGWPASATSATSATTADGTGVAAPGTPPGKTETDGSATPAPTGNAPSSSAVSGVAVEASKLSSERGPPRSVLLLSRTATEAVAGRAAARARVVPVAACRTASCAAVRARCSLLLSVRLAALRFSVLSPSAAPAGLGLSWVGAGRVESLRGTAEPSSAVLPLRLLWASPRLRSARWFAAPASAGFLELSGAVDRPASAPSAGRGLAPTAGVDPDCGWWAGSRRSVPVAAASTKPDAAACA